MENIYKTYKEKLKPFGHDNIDIFIQADPTGKKYVRWIVDSYVNGGIKRDEDLLSRVKPSLEKYEYLKSRNILNRQGELWQQETNIDNYCGIVGCQKKGFEKPGLEDLIDKYKDQLEEEHEETTNTAIQVYNGNTIRIIQPTTKDDACYYGQSTRWCTAAKNDNMFDHYNKSGPLYIIVPKQPRYKDEKYQLSFETEQYMNEKDEGIKLDKLLELYPEIKAGLSKYFIPLEESDLNDRTIALYNARRAINENNLEIFKTIVEYNTEQVNDPMQTNPEWKNQLGIQQTTFIELSNNIKSSEFVDYFRNVLGVKMKCTKGRNSFPTIVHAIKTFDNELLDKFNDCKGVEWDAWTDPIIEIYINDNLYAFEFLVDKYTTQELYSALRMNSPKIAEHILSIIGFYIIEYDYILNNLMVNIRHTDESIKNTDEYKERLSSLLDSLNSYGLLDINLIKRYIIKTGYVKLLDYLQLEIFDSQSLLEITNGIQTNKLFVD
jgi:hypothetical protein